MSETGPPRGFLRRCRDKILADWMTTIVSILVLGAASWVTIWVWDRINTEPPNWQAGTSPEWRIRPIVESQAKPALAEPCDRSQWLQWIFANVFGEECIRLTLDPPELIDLVSQRGPFNETAPPYELLELFVEHHEGCLTLAREANKAIIREAQPSLIERSDGRLICPAQ